MLYGFGFITYLGLLATFLISSVVSPVVTSITSSVFRDPGCKIKPLQHLLHASMKAFQFHQKIKKKNTWMDRDHSNRD